MAEIIAKENEEKQLRYYTATANKKIEETAAEAEFINLSLTQIASNISHTFNNVLDDLLELKTRHKSKKSKSNKNIYRYIIDIIQIFVKEDRLIYIGILLFGITVLLIFI